MNKRLRQHTDFESKYRYDPDKLDKYLSKKDVWAIAFGFIIGWGAFVMPGTDFLPIGGMCRKLGRSL